MKSFLSLLLLLFLTTFSFAQEDETETESEVKTIENQFDRIERTSTTYKPGNKKTYKVINIESFLSLKKDVLDSLNIGEKIILEKNTELSLQKKKINTLIEDVNATKLKLDEAQSNEESISLFGLHLNKTTYNIILWGVIIFLAFGLSFYLYKYRNSHVYTKEAKERLAEVEEEFEEYRKKTLINKQKLRRQLQDEINKQK